MAIVGAFSKPSVRTAWITRTVWLSVARLNTNGVKEATFEMGNTVYHGAIATPTLTNWTLSKVCI